MPPSRRNYRRLAFNAVNAGMKYGPRAIKAYRSYKTATKKSTARTGVTQHRDSTQQYRKRRMPKGKKRQWKKFVKKVQAANERSLGTKTLVFNKAVEAVSSAAGGQQWAMVHLYGNNGSIATELGSKDLYNIVQHAYLATKENQKFTFKSAVLDITMTNTGTTKMEVDLYVLSYWGQPKFSNFNAAISEADTDTPTMNPNADGFFANLNLNARGTTLFDMPNLVRNACFTVQKKVKYWIDIGDTATFQIRDPRTHVIAEQNILNNGSWGIPGKTQSIFINLKPVAGAADECKLTVGATRKYSLNSVDSEDADGYSNT